MEKPNQPTFNRPTGWDRFSLGVSSLFQKVFEMCVCGGGGGGSPTLGSTHEIKNYTRQEGKFNQNSNSAKTPSKIVE